MEEGKKKVLIVDDNQELLDVLADKLTLEGMEVVTGKDGSEGLQLALQNHPDIILLDVMMPKVDGWQMLEELRSDEWGVGATVIMLTNLGDMENISRAVDASTLEYLVKADHTPDEIAKKVKKHLGIA